MDMSALGLVIGIAGLALGSWSIILQKRDK